MSQSQVSDSWVNSPQGRLFVRHWRPALPKADAAPILLLHDSLGCVELWRDFPAQLCAASGREVIAYDRLGFGRSAPRSAPLPLDFISEEARSFFPLLRQQLGLQQVIVFGHSVGGGMAVNIAAESGSDCLALITVSAQAFVEQQTLDGIRAAQQQFRDPQQFGRLQKYHGDKANWVLNAWIDTWLNPAFANWSLAPQLPCVMCPLLAIHGEFDEYGDQRQPQMLVEQSGGPARLEIMRDTGHIPHREQPQRLLQLVADFIQGI